MNPPNTIGSLLLLLAIGNMAMFIRMCITTRRPVKLLVTIFPLVAIPLTIAFAQRLNIQHAWALPLGVCALLAPLTCYCTIHRRSMRSAVLKAPALSQWILQHFAALDVDGDGTISSGDLMSYRDNEGVAPANVILARDAQHGICEIGHVTSVAMSASPHGIAVIHLYGINKLDATSYPARIARAQELEFGCSKAK